MNQLLTPVRIGRYVVPNRLVMAPPMTRSRADAEGVPSDLTVTYYAQRASAGVSVQRTHPWARRITLVF
jgi:N-ethylmaleimide reductase